jgi:hypothetical protein
MWEPKRQAILLTRRLPHSNLGANLGLARGDQGVAMGHPSLIEASAPP